MESKRSGIVYNGFVERSIIKKYAFVLIVIFVIIQRAVPKQFPDRTIGMEILLRVAMGLIAFLFTYLISGKRVFSFFGKGTLYSFKRLKILCIPSFVLTVLLLCFLPMQETLQNDWTVRLIEYLLLFLSVGFFEEMAYRVLINEAMVKSFSEKKHIFLYTAIVSALLFGATHILGSSFHSAIEIITGVLKTVSAGMLGTAFLFLFWKTGNILGAMLIHVLYDFVPLLPSVLYENKNILEIEYVMDGTNGKIAIVGYVISILWAFYILRSLWKKELKDFDFEELRRLYL